MRCVIYDPEDMEPLTVFEVPIEFIRKIERGDGPNPVLFHVQRPMKVIARPPTDAEILESIHEPLPVAIIRFERFIYRDIITWCGMAMNPEMALLLKSEFLPGQQKEAWAERRKGFREGVSEAFKVLGYGR
jgi:hypothetical protein